MNLNQIVENLSIEELFGLRDLCNERIRREFK